MNQEQVKSAIRSIVIAFGSFAVGRGWITTEQLSFLGSDTFLMAIGAVVSLAAGAWGVYTHNQTNAVAVVAAMPEVAKVETTNTPAGKTLAADVGTSPQAVVTVAPK
jgi:hypothetical protein